MDCDSSRSCSQAGAGRYYANRNIIISSSGLLATVAAGRILALSYPVNYQILFVLALSWECSADRFSADSGETKFQTSIGKTAGEA